MTGVIYEEPQKQDAMATKSRWTCSCGAKGRAQEYANVKVATKAAASLGMWHQVTLEAKPDGAVHDVTVEAGGDPIPLTAALGVNALPRFVAPIGHDQVGETGPAYFSQNGEIQDLLDGISLGFNVLLTGPTGCGKTHLVQECARIAKASVVTLPGTEGATYEQIIGYRTIEDGQVKWVDGLLPKAMRAGAWLYADEPNALPDGIRFALFSAMDHRREVTLPENGGEVVKAAAGFTVVASMNEGAGYSGTSLLSHAFRNRFDVGIDLAYLPEEREVELLESRTGVQASYAKRMVEVATSLRLAFQTRQVRTPVSTRTLIAWGKTIAQGKDPVQAAALTILAQVPGTDLAERKAFQDAVEGTFGRKTVAH